MALSDEIGAAYSDTGAAWERGPARVYDRLADLLVSRAPSPVRRSVVADIGAGTGAGGRAARRAGASRVVAFDLAAGMLRADPGRPGAVVADARAIPVRDAAFDLALAAFSLNHLPDPAAGLREAARVVRPGGSVVAGAYSAGDWHPVKEAVEQALQGHGWEAPRWATWLRAEAVPLLATAGGARSAAAEAGLGRAVVEQHEVAFPELDAGAMVAWRMGMAQHAPFLATVPPEERAAIAAEAAALLGPAPPALVRSVVVLAACV